MTPVELIIKIDNLTESELITGNDSKMVGLFWHLNDVLQIYPAKAGCSKKCELNKTASGNPVE